MSAVQVLDAMLFLSTPSARRATAAAIAESRLKYISIHALREEGDGMGQIQIAQAVPISIHALREEGDPIFAVIVLSSVGISIHALREEGDNLHI